jgi:hypothetical protein
MYGGIAASREKGGREEEGSKSQLNSGRFLMHWPLSLTKYFTFQDLWWNSEDLSVISQFFGNPIFLENHLGKLCKQLQ